MPSLSFHVLRLPDFRRLLLVRFLAMMALQAQDVIIGWQIYSLRHDPFLLGLAGLTEAVPALACALVAGHIVDTSRPWRVFLTCGALLALNMLLLAYTGGGHSGMSSDALVHCLFFGIFCSGLLRSFISPSAFVLLPQIVARIEIGAASAWFTSFFQLAAISAPALAGLVYGFYGAAIAWVLPVACMSAAVLALSRMTAPVRAYRASERREKAVKSIKEGWAFIFKQPVLLSVMVLDMFAVLFGGAVAMLPAYAATVLHVGSEGLGVLRASPAIGAVATTLVLAVLPLQPVRGRTLLWAVAGFGAAIVGFGLSASFFFSCLCLLLSGAFDSISMVIRGTLMQLLTPDAMRGRITAVNSMFIISSNEIGAFESGVAATLLGLVPSVVFGGVGAIIVVSVTAWLCPALRRAAVDSR